MDNYEMTAADWDLIDAEGWGWFNGSEIQRDDEVGVFASDSEATEYVLKEAGRDPSGIHARFVRWVLAGQPETKESL